MPIRFIEVDKSSNVPKYEQVVRSVSAAINNKELRRGDKLPSLNEVSKKFSVSVNTVVKAYEHLKKRGVIKSTFGKGFHVATESIEHVMNVFVLFDDFRLFKEDMYANFKEALGSKGRIDIFFHHYNLDVFESLIKDHAGSYDKYVIVPHPDKASSGILEAIEPDKIVILDQKHYIDGKYAYVAQDFENQTYECLESGIDLLKKYRGLRLMWPSPESHPELEPYAIKIERGINRLCGDHGMEYSVAGGFSDSDIEAGYVHIVLNDSELVELVKMCKGKGYAIGKDVGIVSYNETELKEVIEGGITTLSTDFKQMGKTAARLVLENSDERIINPASLIIRNSL